METPGSQVLRADATADLVSVPELRAEAVGHARWVRVSHWILTASILTLAFTGFVVLMAHPRLYWGETGNNLTPALFELPISRNHRHGGWQDPVAFFPESASGGHREPDLRHIQPERLGPEPALPVGVVPGSAWRVLSVRRDLHGPLPPTSLAP
jgi:hypothetical protein